MKALSNTLSLEVRLQLRSRVTVVLLLVLLAAIFISAFAVYGWLKAMTPTLEFIQHDKGAAFTTWLAHAADARPYRDDLMVLQPHMGVSLALTSLGFIGPLLAAIWGARALGLEFGQRTVRLRAVNEGWTRVVLSKQLLVVVAAFAAAAVVSLLGVLVGRVLWSLALSRVPELASFPLPHPSFSAVFGAAVVALGVAFYGLLGCLAALLTRSTAAGIVVAVAVPYLENLLSAWWLPQGAYGSLLKYTLVYRGGSFIAAPVVKHAAPSAVAALAVLGCWLVAVVLVTAVAARRQEIA